MIPELTFKTSILKILGVTKKRRIKHHFEYFLNDSIDTRDFFRRKKVNKIGMTKLFNALIRDSERKIKAINGYIKYLKRVK